MLGPDSATSQQLERVLTSPGFAQNERLSRFLRFLVERQLEGRESELKESVIGIEVFGRRPDYNPKRDAIVRTEAGRLRSRLAEYYANGGKLDALVIELPKGGYVPLIRLAEPKPDPPATSARRFRLPVRTMIVIATVVAVAGLVLLWAAKKGPASVTTGKPNENAYNGFGNSHQLRR